MGVCISKITHDIMHPNPEICLRMMQDDQWARTLEITLLKGGEEWIPDSAFINYDRAVYYRREGDTGGYQEYYFQNYQKIGTGSDYAVSNSGSKLYVELSDVVTEKPGTAYIMISLHSYSPFSNFFTFPIRIEVYPSIYDEAFIL